MKMTAFDRFAGLCALLAGAVTLCYSFAFIIIAPGAPALGALLSAVCLLLSGLLATAVFAALYGRLQTVDAGLALWALLLSTAGALGAAIHGGYDLANALHTPALPADLAAGLGTLPSQIDPRGLLTFGVAGLALFGVAPLLGRAGGFPGLFRGLTYLLAALLVIIYLARLIILSPANPLLLVPVLLAGFVVNPLWWLWLGVLLLRRAEGRRAFPVRDAVGV
jgi:hypothetical protein